MHKQEVHGKRYLNSDAKVVAIFYLGDEVLNPAGDLHTHTRGGGFVGGGAVPLVAFISAWRAGTYGDDGLPEGDDLRFHLLQKQRDLLVALDEAALWS